MELGAHACNPNYSGGRDHEDHSSKPAGQIVRETLSQKHPSQKRAGGVAQGVGPEFKPQYCRKKRKERRENISPVAGRKWDPPHLEG
jgi:hypothetical protein